LAFRQQVFNLGKKVKANPHEGLVRPSDNETNRGA